MKRLKKYKNNNSNDNGDVEAILGLVNKVAGENHNVTLELGSVRAIGDATRVKLTAVIKHTNRKNTKVETKIFKKIFMDNAKENGFKNTDLGRQFTDIDSGKVFTIVGWDRRKYKYPIIAEAEDSQLFSFKIESIKKNLLVVEV